MPGVPGGGNPFLARMGQIDQLVRGLATQQQDSITNALGEDVLNFGLIPGSEPAEYGIQLVNPATGAEVGFLGQDSTGTAALRFRDAAGNVIVQVDVNGIHIYNDAGTEEARFGILNDSPAIYGLGVLPYGGSELQQVAGTQSSDPGHLNSTTVTSWTVPTGASALTLEIGPSGAAAVTVTGQCSTGTGGQEAYIGCQIDGASVPVSALVASGTGGVSISTAAGPIVVPLAANTNHTFEPVVQTAANGSSTCTFTNVLVTVTPL